MTGDEKLQRGNENAKPGDVLVDLTVLKLLALHEPAIHLQIEAKLWRMTVVL